MSRRMRDREMEAEGDHRDKQRELEEIDEILRKRLADPSIPPIEKENEVCSVQYHMFVVFNMFCLFCLLYSVCCFVRSVLFVILCLLCSVQYVLFSMFSSC